MIQNFEGLLEFLNDFKKYRKGLNSLRYFNLDVNTLEWSLSTEPKKNSLVIEDWQRYFDYDAAMEYENPSEFVAECILEEIENRLEMESWFNESLNELNFG